MSSVQPSGAANGPAVCFPIWRFVRRADPYAAALRYIDRHYAGDPLRTPLLESVRAAMAASPRVCGGHGACRAEHC